MALQARLTAFRIAAILGAALFLVTCTRPTEPKVITPAQPKAQVAPVQPKAEVAPEKPAEQAEEKPAQTVVKKPSVVHPAARSASIVFLSGDVAVDPGTGWETAEIGALVPRGSTLRVGDESTCQLQFGKAAVVSIEQKTIVAIDAIVLEKDRSKVVLGLDAGALICKVNTLTTGSKFKVMTQTAICGVRGTEFIVRVGDQKQTVLAVKKGTVSILPATRKMQRVRERLTDESDPLAPALEKLEDTAPVVKGGRQVVVTHAEATKSETAYSAVEEKLSLLLEKREKGMEVSSTDVQDLEKTVDTAAPVIEKLVETPKPVSKANMKSLERTDIMLFREMPEGGESEAISERVKAQPVRITIRTVPADAELSLNGVPVGKGECLATYTPGDSIVVTASRGDYETKSMKIRVTENAPSVYELRLEPRKGQIRINTTPADAEIFLEGRLVGKGVYTGAFPVGTNLTFAARKNGFGAKDLEVTVKKGARRSYLIELEENKGQVLLNTIPADAEILIDGTPAGTGSFTGLFRAGEKHSVLVRAEGYYEKSLELSPEAGSDLVFHVSLDAKPIERRFAISSQPIVGRPAIHGASIIVADSAGVLSAATIRGESLWTVPTTNSPNENSSPQLIGDEVCFSGARELVAVDVDSGNTIFRQDMDSASAHPFGQRLVGVEQNLALPANDFIRLLSPDDGSLIKTIRVPEGSKMTPTLWEGDFLIVNQAGALLRLDPDTDTTVFRVPTKAVQPVALAVRTFGTQAYFADRKGLVVCVDLQKKEAVWSRSAAGSAGIFQDLECGKEGVFAYAKGSIHGFARENGTPLFGPLSGVTCPPLLHDRMLYFGNDKGEFVVAEAATGKIVKRLGVDAHIVSRPEWTAGKVVACAASGEILVLRPEAIQ